MLGNVSVISIILFLVGIAFVIIELYQPGFGFFGIAGLVCLVVCIFVTAQTVRQGLILSAVFFVLLIILLVIFFTLISKGRLPKKLVLQESTSAELGFSGAEDMRHLLGKTGTVMSTCRPAGNADFDGAKHDVISRGEFIDKGATVEVIEIEGVRIVVIEKKEEG